MPISGKICLALIHNQNPERVNYIRPKIKEIKKRFSSQVDIEIFEVFYQPKKIESKAFLTLFIKILYWHINREVSKYKENKRRNLLVDISILFIGLLNIFTDLHKQIRRFAIEAIIADKHIRAWSSFLEKNADLLICFEDDVVFRDNSLSQLKKILKHIKTIKTKKPLYIDLAGGNNREVTKTQELIKKHDNLGDYYKKPITNTACCYLINKQTGQIFIDQVTKMPWLRLICADWVMNKIFVTTEKINKYYCLHSNPTVFKHGSLTGEYRSMYDEIFKV